MNPQLELELHRFRSKDNLTEEFLERCTLIEETNCWEWTATFQRKTTPFFAMVNRAARPVSLELFRGITVPKGAKTQDSCGNSWCVNPDHLSLPSDTITTKRRKVPDNPQRQKRRIQKELDTRLAHYADFNPELRGGIVALTGTKVMESIQSYFQQDLAKHVLITENNQATHAAIHQIIQAFPEDYKHVTLWEKPANVFMLTPKLNRAKPGYWRGFDLDFDCALTPRRRGKLVELTESINAPTWWLRLTLTVRPLGDKATRKGLDDFLRYVGSRGSLMIEDVASGPAYAYYDSAAMMTTQVIVTRRGQ